MNWSLLASFGVALFIFVSLVSIYSVLCRIADTLQRIAQNAETNERQKIEILTETVSRDRLKNLTVQALRTTHAGPKDGGIGVNV